MTGGIALHTCGGLGAESLAPLAEAGVSCGAIHPLQAIATPEQGLVALPVGVRHRRRRGRAGMGWQDRSVAGWRDAADTAREQSTVPRRRGHGQQLRCRARRCGCYADGCGGHGARTRRWRPSARWCNRARERVQSRPGQGADRPYRARRRRDRFRSLRTLARTPEPVRGLYRSGGTTRPRARPRRGFAKDRARLIEAMLRKSGDEDV